MPQPSRRQQLVDAVWPAVAAACAKEVEHAATRGLRAALGERSADSDHVPTVIVEVPQPPFTGGYLLAAELVATSQTGMLLPDPAAGVSAAVGDVLALENGLLSAVVRARAAVSTATAADLWALGGLAGAARTAMRWHGGIDLLLGQQLFEGYEGDSAVDKRAALLRLLAGGSVVPATGLGPAEAVFVRQGSGDHTIGVASDLSVAWDVGPGASVVFTVSEHLVIHTPPVTGTTAVVVTVGATGP